METKFNFNSQVCTSKAQSERLLALGLKKETADMAIEVDYESCYEAYYISAYPPTKTGIPAWSLHRLMESMPLLLDIHRDWVAYMTYASGERNPYNRYLWESQNTNIYDAFIDCIEWLIKEGYFNKVYLV